jgi:hypothetical protein
MLLSTAGRVATLAGLLWAVNPSWAEQIPATPVLAIPRLAVEPRIDADLSDWRDVAFTDGVWDIDRLRQTPWFQGVRNRLTDHGTATAPEPAPRDDLAARYYTAWDERWLYMGADVRDNVNDVDDPAHEPRRWYFKDSVCWFMEGPRDAAPERFGRGDNAFCFVIDESRPDYGAWWRHGTAERNYVEEPLPAGTVEYALRVAEDSGDFVLEARVDLAATFGASDPDWERPVVGHEYGLEIVHCDPDGGPYGGHFIIYGTGDDDETWARAVLSPPATPVSRLTE